MNADPNQEDLKKIDSLKKGVLNKILSKEAIERLGRLRLVKPDLTAQIELYLVQLYQEGKIGGNVTDDQIKQLLNALTAKKDFRIRR